MIAYRHNYAALRVVPQPPEHGPRPILRPRIGQEKAASGHKKPKGSSDPALDLLHRINRLGRLHGLPDATMGREALNDPNAIHDLRKGRRFRAATRDRIVAYLDRLEGRA